MVMGAGGLSRRCQTRAARTLTSVELCRIVNSVFDADQRNAGFGWGLLGVCDSLRGGTPMSDLHTLLVIFIGLAATFAVWLGTMGLSFLLH